jgi:hypothetical protein
LLLLALCAAAPADEAVSQDSFRGNPRFWSLGGAMGSSFTIPWIIGTVQGTASFFPWTIVELGCDFGLVHGYRNRPDVEYFSLYPFGHINGYVPLGALGGWYGGLGSGLMLAFYTIGGSPVSHTIPAFDLTSGFYLGKNRHYITIAWTLRTNFADANHKVSLGYSYRFKEKKNSTEDGDEEIFNIRTIRR